ncbi:redox-sensitive transcriptional activator SoxR [Endozoicomonadaceae bacterium StTr2]
MTTSIKRSLTIGETVERSGVAASALRFYESRGLIHSYRTNGNQRRFHSSMLRRIAVIQVAQKLGMTLEEIKQALSTLPDNRTPTKRDWDKLATQWRKQMDDRISRLEDLRDNLSSCIGCGCLSMQQCRLVNPEDILQEEGSGPRQLVS